MKRSNIYKLEKLERELLPKPEPDMTGWTSMERFNWQARHRTLPELQRESYESTEPILTEVLNAREAEDQAILAERAAKAAAERLAQHPGSAAAQLNARATREAADKAKQAAEQARRSAEEAKLRPPPPEPEPAIEAKAPTNTSARVSEPKPTPKRQRKRRELGMPKPGKQWWEERAQWRMREPQDEDERRGRPLYRCLIDYDPLEWDNGEDDEIAAE